MTQAAALPIATTLANTRHRVRLLVAPDGERLPVLVDSAGMPAFDAAVYTVSMLRPGSGSHGTVQQSLSASSRWVGRTAPRSSFTAVDVDVPP